jgi:hypothetical protein
LKKKIRSVFFSHIADVAKTKRFWRQTRINFAKFGALNDCYKTIFFTPRQSHWIEFRQIVMPSRQKNAALVMRHYYI